jgi:hypothetical protein
LNANGEDVTSDNPLFKWWTTDGRSAKVDPGFTSEADGTIVPAGHEPVTSTEYIGALPKTTAIAVIVVCCVVGALLVALVVAFIVKRRRPAYVDTV